MLGKARSNLAFVGLYLGCRNRLERYIGSNQVIWNGVNIKEKGGIRRICGV